MGPRLMLSVAVLLPITLAAATELLISDALALALCSIYPGLPLRGSGPADAGGWETSPSPETKRQHIARWCGFSTLPLLFIHLRASAGTHFRMISFW